MTIYQDIANNKNRHNFKQGHRTCPGCAIPIIIRTTLAAIDEPVIIINATGCMEVTSTIYPYTSWNVPFMHNAFENASATMSGIESAYKALKKKGKIKDDIKFVVFGGDGGTYDIGLQSLSGAIERKHDFLYICYDNEAYANTGDQQSGATPLGTKTKTTPVGSVVYGKKFQRKNLTKVIAGHDLPYCAQASISNLQDFTQKIKKAIKTKGPSFINVLSTCTRYWGIEQNQTIEIPRIAVETNFWPLYEVENGKYYTINYKPKKKINITEFLFKQGRFKHLKKHKDIVDNFQEQIDKDWNYLLKLEQINKE